MADFFLQRFGINQPNSNEKVWRDHFSLAGFTIHSAHNHTLEGNKYDDIKPSKPLQPKPIHSMILLVVTGILTFEHIKTFQTFCFSGVESWSFGAWFWQASLLIWLLALPAGQWLPWSLWLSDFPNWRSETYVGDAAGRCREICCFLGETPPLLENSCQFFNLLEYFRRLYREGSPYV